MFDAFRGCINTVATFTDSPDLSNCTDLTRMFYDCQSIEMDIDNWDVSNIASINAMFINCRLFNSPLNSWDLSSIGSSLSSIFQGCYAFNQPIGNWGNYFVGKNINLYRVFRDCRSFNQDLTNWNQANQFVGSFYELFYSCNAFEGLGLETWNVRPDSMYYAFGLCYNFNADISGWDMSNVSDMQRTFVRASSFNQPIGSWDMSSVTKIGFMFEFASSFDQDISSWSVNQITNFSNNFMRSVTLSTANYDALLIAWDAQGAMSYSGTVNFGSSRYTLGGNAEAARTSLIAKWGGIVDGGGVGAATFDIQVKTDNAGTSNNDQFTLPWVGTYDVDWGDGNVDTSVSGTQTHTYASAGTYDISVTATTGRIYFNNGGDKAKLLDVKQWSSCAWTSMSRAFYGCTVIQISATDAPNLINCTDFSWAFRSCTNLNPNIDHWDVSTITNFEKTFVLARNFNSPLNSWNVSSATTMSNMFYIANSFNQPLDNWDVSSVSRMDSMFNSAGAFNQPLNSWNVSGVTRMDSMFRSATLFNQPLNSWNVNQVTNLSNFATGVTLSTANYDALLIAWDAQGAMSFSGTADFGNSQYTLGGDAEAARTSLISKWGGIIDGGGV